MTVADRLLPAAILLLPAGTAAQTLPWPGEPGAPMMRAPRPMDGGAPPCMAKFTKLREDVEMKGMAAKAAGQRHAARDEMCKYVTIYTAAEARWVEFSEAAVQSCGIPIQIANQLKQVLANTEETREKICTGWSPQTPHPHPLVGDFDLPQPTADALGVIIPKPPP